MADQGMTKDLAALVGIFAISGVVHLVKPEVYEPIMPKIVPAHRAVIYASGVAELACAAGLLRPSTRSTAAWASLAVLFAVYPANLKMAIDSSHTSSATFKGIAFGRLPMQLPMVWTAYRTARRR
jgi:uncharacterized membrane protein